MATTQVRSAQVKDELTDTDFAAANKDGADGVLSLRTLGINAGQAFPGDSTTFSGTASIATSVAVADTTDTTCFVSLFESATGNQGCKTDAGLTYNASTATLTATTFSGALSGNATTATALQTPRTINGTAFDGTANITVTAAAGTLTGTTLVATVVTSSLTSVGTITTGVWNGTTIALANGGTGTTTAVAGYDVFHTQGADVASATTTNLSTATGAFVNITGTTTITAFTSQTAGQIRRVIFTGALTLTHNATSLKLPGQANITTAANDRAEFLSLGSGNWICMSYVAAASAGGNAATVTVADAAADTTTWVMLATAQTGSLAPATDAGLTYNASTNALTATTFIGALTGASTTATTATTVTVADTNNTSFIAMFESATGNLGPKTDANFQYDPSNGRINTWAANFTTADSSTNSTVNAIAIGHNTDGTPEAGFGTTISWRGESTTTVDTTMALLYITWDTATHASRKAQAYFQVFDTGAGREIWRGLANGTLPAISFLGATPSIQLVSPDVGTALVTFGLASGTPTFAVENLTGTTLPSSITTTGALTNVVNDAVTNTTTTILTIAHNSSGTPAANFGLITKFQLDTSTTNNTEAADLTVTWATATHASRKARVVHNVYDTAIREGFRIEASGTAPMIGVLGAAASARLVSPDAGTALVTFGWASGTCTFATANLTGTALPAAIVTSSLTSVGTITIGTWTGTDIAVADGGTGRSTHTAYAVICGGTTTTTAQQSIASVGTTGQSLKSNGAGVLPTFQSEGIIILRDEKTTGTAGGTFTLGAWRTRTLNVEATDVNGDCTLSSNQFTLAAGTYEIMASAPGFKVSTHQIKLYNVTDTADVIIGTSEASNTADIVQSRSLLRGVFTIAASKALEIQHYSVGTQATNGLGTASSSGSTEVYAEVYLRRIS